MPETSWPVSMSALGGAFGSRLGPRPGSLGGGLVEGGGSAGVEGIEGEVPAGGTPVLGGTPPEPPPGEPPPLLDPPPPLFLGGGPFLRVLNLNSPTPRDPLSPFTVTLTVK